MLKRISLLLKETVVYTVCASLFSLPYYGTASAQTSSTNANMQSAAMAGREMQNSAISDLKGYVNKLGYGAKDLVPQSVNGVNNGKGMTVDDVQKLMGIYKDNDEYRKQGNSYIVDLEKRSVNADSSDPEAAAYSVLKTVSAFPKNQITENDPIVQKTKETLEGLEDFSKTLANCTAMEEYLLQERVVHEPIYEQCTRVIDKTGSCQIQHLYDLKEPIEHAGGPYNVGACEGEQGCINIWIGKVGDNYWSGHCSVYEESTQVRVVNPKAIKRAVLEYTKWDDYMMVYVGKQGQEELIWTGPVDWRSNPNYFPPETPGKCELSTSWEAKPEVDVTKWFKEVDKDSIITFRIRVSVSGEGEGYGRLRVEYDPGAILEGDKWTPEECFDLAKAVSDGMAQGSVQCVEMPGNATPAGNCVTVGGYQVCEDRFGASPLKGISRLCRKVNVTANYSFYKGDMDCYTATDGTLVCPKNEGGNLDDCQKLVDAGCTYIKSECTEGAQGNSGNCYVYTNTYDCGYDQVVSTPVSEKSFKCSGSVACMGTDCITTDFTQSTDFTKAAALLHVAQQASKDMTCTGTDENGNATGTEDVVCTLFGGSSYECKKAVGGIQNCCEQPTSVNFVDYITMTFKVYMADSAMMSLNREMQPSFVGAYQDLHNSAVEIVKQGLSPVTKPLTSYAENISGAVKNFFQPLTAAIDEIKKKISQAIADMINTMLQKMGIQAGAGAAGAAESSAELAKVTANQVSEAIGTAVAVVGYVYVAYQVAMLVIQTIYKCEEKEFELASNRALRQCHYVGSYCKSKVLGACIEKRYSYCCYKSPLGRILQEQIRSQLYGSANFGSAKHPQCEGISIADFGKVNWDAINLDEWVAMSQEAGFMGADVEKLTMEALTGTGGPSDYEGQRFNAQERASQRLDGAPIDEVRQKLEEQYLMPGDKLNAPQN